MFLTLLTLLVALVISCVSAYFSIVGLTMIFSGAFYAVLSMGASLEVGKLVTASWLYNNWKSASFLLKTYLCIAVFILMSITSLGIFGFLSRAHIEQNANAQENTAIVERINNDVARLKINIEKAETRLKQLESTGGGADVNIQNQITIEQARIDSAYKRIQPAIDEQNKLIDSQIKILTDQIQAVDNHLSTLQKYIDSSEVAKAQSMVGTKADGSWGPGTAQTVKLWQNQKEQEKQNILNKVESANKNNQTIILARSEIQRLRQSVETQVDESNKLINKLREQLGKSSAEDLNRSISEQQHIIKEANRETEELTEKKFKLESNIRKIESEVGPIKYIANFVSDNRSDPNLLEKAVTWMILVIVLVFDPLAVLLLIAANTGLQNKFKDKPSDENLLDQWNRMIEEAEKAMTKSLPVEKSEDKPSESVTIEPKPKLEIIKKQKNFQIPASALDKLIDISMWNNGKQNYFSAKGQVGFGTAFPNEDYAERYFIRTDSAPTRVFEYIENHWAPVDHSVLLTLNTDTYTLHLMYCINNNLIKKDSLTSVEIKLVETKNKNNDK